MLVLLRDREPSETRNVIPSDRWDHFISTQHAGYPLPNAKTDNLVQSVLTYGQRLSHNRFQAVTSIRGDDFTIRAVGLLGLNRAEPSALPSGAFTLPNQARLLIDDILFPTGQPLVSSSNYSLTNLTGVYGILNQPINPPELTPIGYTATHLTATSGTSNTILSLRFDNLSGGTRPLATGTDVQEIQVAVRDSAAVATFPIIVTVLTQGGVDVSTLTEYEIEKTTEGYIYKYLWNIPGSTQDIGVRVTGSTTGSTTVEPIAVVWRAKVQNMELETAWADIENSTQVVWLPAPILVLAGEERLITIELSDFSTTIDDTVAKPGGGFAAVKIYTPLGDPLTIGRFAAGNGLTFSLIDGGHGMEEMGENESGETRYGAPHGTRIPLSWTEEDYSVEYAGLESTLGPLRAMYRETRFNSPTLMVPYEDHPELARWVRITSWSVKGQGTLTGDDGADIEAAGTSPRFAIDFSTTDHMRRRVSDPL